MKNWFFAILFAVLSVQLAAQELNRLPLTVDRVVDGDTIVADVHLGLNVTLEKQVIRFLDYDAWETKKVRGADDAEVVKGEAAKKFLTDLVRLPITVTVRPGAPARRDAYGRLLLQAYADGRSISDIMKEKGHARPARKTD